MPANKDNITKRLVIDRPLTHAEGDANSQEIIEIITDFEGHEAAADPHSQYATDQDLTDHVNAADPHGQYTLESDLADASNASLGSALVGHRGSDVRSELDRRAIYVDTINSLKGISGTDRLANQHAYVTTTERSGTFVWKAGDQSANITNDPQEGVWVAPDDDATGTSGAWYRLYDKSQGLSAAWFGMDESATDTTNATAITEARRYAQNNDIFIIRLEEGQFDVAQFSLFDVSGSIRQQRGDVRIKGAGSLRSSDVYGTTNSATGTILNLTELTNDGIIAADGDTKQRRVIFEDLTLVYGGASYAVGMRYCPFHEFRGVSISVSSAGGGAVDVADSWGGVYEKFIAICRTGVTSTAIGVNFNATLFAGNIKFKDSLIDNFDVCVKTSGSSFVNFILDNTWLQKFNTYGLHVTSPIWNLILRDHYTESDSGASVIRIAPAAGVVSTVTIDGIYILGGNTTTGWLSAPAIDLNDVQTYEMTRIKFFRPFTNLLRHQSNVGSGSISNMDIHHDNASSISTPFNVIVGANGKDGNLAVSDYTIRAGVGKITLFDDTSVRVAKYDGTGAIMNALSHGKLKKVTLNVSTYDLSADDPRSMVVLMTVEGGAVSALRLPVFSTIEDTDIRYIINSPASAQGLVLRNSGNTNIGMTLSPGEGAFCIADKTSSKWIAVKSVAAYGP